MALDPGSAKAGTGSAGRLVEKLREKRGNASFKLDDATAELIDAIAEWFVEECQVHADVEVGGVQSGGDTASGNIL